MKLGRHYHEFIAEGRSTKCRFCGLFIYPDRPIICMHNGISTKCYGKVEEMAKLKKRDRRKTWWLELTNEQQSAFYDFYTRWVRWGLDNSDVCIVCNHVMEGPFWYDIYIHFKKKHSGLLILGAML